MPVFLYSGSGQYVGTFVLQYELSVFKNLSGQGDGQQHNAQCLGKGRVLKRGEWS